MRSVEEELQTPGDGGVIGKRHDQLSAGLQHPREFAERIERIGDVLRPLDEDRMIEAFVLEGKPRRQVALDRIVPRHREIAGIDVAARGVESQPEQPPGQRAGAARHVEHPPARKALHDAFDSLVDRRP